MKKASSFKYIFAEALILLNFLAFVAGVVMIPLLEPEPFALVALALGLMLSIAIALAYGLFIFYDKPPLGERLVTKLAPIRNKK